MVDATSCCLSISVGDGMCSLCLYPAAAAAGLDLNVTLSSNPTNVDSMGSDRRHGRLAYWSQSPIHAVVDGLAN